MGIKLKRLNVLVSLLAVSILAQGNDLRLVEATKNGDQEAVRSLLKQRIDVNARQADGATALAWAAYRDDLETAGLLIGAGSDVNAANDYGATPLLLACDNGSAAMVDRLLKSGANPKAAGWTGDTALMGCARTGNVEAVKSLLTRGADVNAKDNRQMHTALLLAVAEKHPEVARMLIEHGADVHARSKGGFTALMFAAQQGDQESAQVLLNAGADVNAATPDGDTPLLVASLSGYEELSIYLLNQGANPNAVERNGITALHYALLSGLVAITGISKISTGKIAPYLTRPNMRELTKALLAHGANPNARLVSPSVSNDGTLRYGKIIRVDTVNGGGGSVSPVGATPFLMAALTYDTSLMRTLVASGADPRLATVENVTPLMAAAGLTRPRDIGDPLPEEEEARALETVKLAAELGGDVNAVNNLGLTALHGAAFCGSNAIVRFLVEKGANLNAKDQAGQTPLDKALNIRPAGVVPINLLPAVVRRSTADLLLKLGATAVSAAIAQGSEVSSVQPVN